MKKVTFLSLLLTIVSVLFSQINAQTLYTEKFDYPTDTKLTSLGWALHSGNDDMSTKAGANLYYRLYPFANSNKDSGYVVIQGKGVATGDYNHSFTTNPVLTGAVYTSFLLRVDSAGLAGDYFFHYKLNATSNYVYPGRLFVRDDSTKTGHFTFGIQKGSSGAVYTSTKFEYKKTYLVVVKYEYVGDTTGTNDKVSLFVNPGATEPAQATLVATDAGHDQAIDAIALRQGNYCKLALDGIRVVTVWDSLDISKLIPVTFQANMKVMLKEGKFTPGTDRIVARGSFQTDAGDTGDWQGTKFEFTDANNDSIYTFTADFPAAKVGTVYQYKLVLPPDGWEANQPTASTNREFTLTAPSMVLYPAFYNNDSVANVSEYAGKKFKITFTADISSIYNNGFNPNKDSLLVQGLDWDGLGKEVVGHRKMTEGLTAGVFETTLQVTALTDSVTFKYRLFPNSAFGDDGWEKVKANRVVYFKDFAGKDSMALEPVSPEFIILKPGITKDITVLFQVNVTGAKNAYDGSDIALKDIQFVGLKGADTVLGRWQGNWVVTDTTSKTLLVLNDAGLLGDKVPGDNIWSREVIFKAGTPSGERSYKYGIWYTGADQHSKGSARILDNEANSENNHIFDLKDEPSGRIELKNNFGNMTTDVKQVKTNQVPKVYSLDQNYPNPFNPATTIRYSVPKAGMVTLKIYNMLGQEVATLVHAQQNAGNFEVSFDASRLSSGIYLYSLTSGSFSSTKKMMLVK